MLKKIYRDIGVSIFFIIFSVAGIIIGINTPKGLISGGVGANFLPTLCSLLIGLLSVFLLASSLKSLSKEKEKSLPDTEAEQKGDTEEDHTRKRVVAQTILSFIYIILFNLFLKQIGFLIMAPLYLFIQMSTIAPREKRKLKDILRYLIIAVVVTAAVYYVFTYGFKIVIPMGIFK